ncbi:hypothetical protein L1049_014097 [Liquidambar formosana]|uniref:Response regulatory domain-containing protein n=1 Tax=Liquidambar formosana TaxID=63359 RepID=A0AAP0RMT5_LIQFO
MRRCLVGRFDRDVSSVDEISKWANNAWWLSGGVRVLRYVDGLFLFWFSSETEAQKVLKDGMRRLGEAVVLLDVWVPTVGMVGTLENCGQIWIRVEDLGQTVGASDLVCGEAEGFSRGDRGISSTSSLFGGNNKGVGGLGSFEVGESSGRGQDQTTMVDFAPRVGGGGFNGFQSIGLELVVFEDGEMVGLGGEKCQNDMDSSESVGLLIDNSWESTSGEVDDVPLGDVPDVIANYHICIVKSMKLDSNIISRANQMKLIMQYGVGLEGVDIDAATKCGIKIARIPSDITGNAASCAEMAIYLILGLLRKQNEMQIAVRQKKLGEPVGETLLGKTVFILGFGNIGIELAKRLRPFGVRIIATKRNWASHSQYSCQSEAFPIQNGIIADLVDGKGGQEDLYEFASKADIVVCCLRMNSETAGIVNKRFISSMKKGALLVNIARGGLLDYEAVTCHLESGHLGGLGIDVAWTEPFDPDDPILKFQNVLITPHVAGVTEFSYRSMSKIVGDVALQLHGVINGCKSFHLAIPPNFPGPTPDFFPPVPTSPSYGSAPSPNFNLEPTSPPYLPVPVPGPTYSIPASPSYNPVPGPDSDAVAPSPTLVIPDPLVPSPESYPPGPLLERGDVEDTQDSTDFFLFGPAGGYVCVGWWGVANVIIMSQFDEPRDQFPVGMRVLAVDDDPTCLLLLETLLRRCQYHVTTTNQAVKALDMLRENKNMFDLVISDVHMPDMDGFKLLELVGLEMDLPVIMLSANGDPKLVMKGITHGACDYLLKPIRIEELKNIWQHVIRRKKFDSKEQNNPDKPHHGTGEGGHDSTGMGNSDQNGKLNKKRKDQNEDEDDERDENGLDNDDPSTQKKPRVVWSVELHRKFVAAVNQLGIDSRFFIPHHSDTAFGSTDPSYLRMGPLNGLGNFHTMAGSGQFQSAGFRSFPHSGMVGRLNTPAGLGIRGLSSPGMVQLGHAHVSYPINDRAKFQPGLLPGNQGGSILQGMPMSLELDHLQNNRSVTNIGELSTTIDDSTLFPVSSGLPDTKITIGSSSDSLLGVPNNLFMLQGHPQETQSRGGFGNQSSVTVASLSSEVSSPLPDLGRCNDNWPSAVQSSGIQSNSLPINDCFKQATLYTRSLRDNMSSMGPDIGSHSHDVSSIASAPTRLQDSRIDLQCQAAPISSNSARNVSCTSQQIWENHKQDISHHPNLMCNSVNSSIVAHGVVGPLGQSLEPKHTISPRNMDFNLIGQSNFVDPLSIQRNEVERSAMETSVKLKQGYLMGQGKAQGSYTSNNFGSLEDLVSAMMKQEEGKMTFTEEDIGCDNFSLGTCI